MLRAMKHWWHLISLFLSQSHRIWLKYLEAWVLTLVENNNSNWRPMSCLYISEQFKYKCHNCWQCPAGCGGCGDISVNYAGHIQDRASCKTRQKAMPDENQLSFLFRAERLSGGQTPIVMFNLMECSKPIKIPLSICRSWVKVKRWNCSTLKTLSTSVHLWYTSAHWDPCTMEMLRIFAFSVIGISPSLKQI